MGRVYYNKLIRDNIPEKIEKAGEQFDVREIEDDQEFQQELLKKIAEESSALSKARSREEFLEEYADLHAVLEAAIRALELSNEEVAAACEANVTKKGTFAKRLFLHWSSDGGYKSNETPQGITQK